MDESFKRPLGAALFLLSSTTLVSASSLAPDGISNSNFMVKAEFVGQLETIAPVAPAYNFASPAAAGNDLILVDQWGQIYRDSGDGNPVSIFNASTDAPDGMILQDREAVLSVAANADGSKLYVAFTADNMPSTLAEVHELPDALPGKMPSIPFNPDPETLIDVEDLYRLKLSDLAGLPGFIPANVGVKNQVIYEYDLGPDGLSNPKALAAFEVQSSFTGHHGGGLVVAPTGEVLYATGDNLPFGTNGREAAQDDNEHVSKLFVINPETGEKALAAKGLRNVQQLTIGESDGTTYLAFADIGGVTAEEVNVVPLADILETSEIENFGWGIAEDGNGREGTFYVGPGIPGILGSQPPATGAAPIGEAGFVQPYAQYGRVDPPAAFVAVSGSVLSDEFDFFEMLFGDLASGNLFATTGGLDEVATEMFNVALVDEEGAPTSLSELADGRPDARFFTFGDGGAGVLLESTGGYYRLTDMTIAPVPLPAMLPAFTASFGLMALLGRRRRRAAR